MSRAGLAFLFLSIVPLTALAAELDGAVKPVDRDPYVPPRAEVRTGAAKARSVGPLVLLAAPDMAAIEREDAQLKGRQKSRFRIGVRRALPSPVALAGASARWEKLADGSMLWAVTLESPDAVGIRVRLENVALPEGCSIMVYDPSDPGSAAGPYDGSRRDSWSESVFASRVVVECHAPDAARAANASFAIQELVHIYIDPVRPSLRKEGSCHNDVTCHPSYANERNAVAGIGTIGDSGYLWCTGCLLNDTDTSTFIDYFMTANHCVGNQGEADTIELYWFFQTSTCNGAVPDASSVPRTGGGAAYLAGRSDVFGNDFSFLRLNKAAPGGVGYAGWSTTKPTVSETLVCIHHPDGAYKRLCYGNRSNSTPNYWNVMWRSGVTEPGSSGSPLFNGSRKFIGQLWGGDSACNEPGGIDDYGRFDVSFPHIKAWLQPSPTNGLWYIYNLSAPSQAILFGLSWGGAGMMPVSGDYDGDGRYDLAMFQTATGNWYIRSPQVGGSVIALGVNWGGPTMTPVPGDYDGDGVFDLAVFEATTGKWYIRRVAGGKALLFGFNWGGPTMTPVPGDYDGDGRWDLGLYERATGRWYVYSLAKRKVLLLGLQWGGSDMEPVWGDYNGDLRFDLCVFERAAGRWYALNPLVSPVAILGGVSWGGGTMTPVPGSYNNDLAYDLAMFESSTGNWYIRNSINGRAITFGLNWGGGMTPVAGDYNADGRSDLAVWK